MGDFIGWLTDVFNLGFTLGTVTITLGYVVIAAYVLNRAIAASKKIK